jgi:hypothetical protein
MARHTCLDCVRKHLAQASVLMDEAALGYPHHRWLAVGHMAEAESESLREQPQFSQEIRACRIEIMTGKPETNCIEELIRKACILAGDTADVNDSPLNSKQFETNIEPIELTGLSLGQMIEIRNAIGSLS